MSDSLEIDETIKVLISMRRSEREMIDAEAERLKVPRSKLIVFAVKQLIEKRSHVDK